MCIISSSIVYIILINNPLLSLTILGCSSYQRPKQLRLCLLICGDRDQTGVQYSRRDGL